MSAQPSVTTALSPRDVARLGLVERYRAASATHWLEATGISMQPLVAPGSRLLVEFGRTDARIGDVVLFARGGTLVAHRLVARRRTGAGPVLIPKGDGEVAPDAAIRASDVLGIVRVIERPDGSVERTCMGGRSGALIAGVSWWSARAGRLGRHFARRAPRPVRPLAMAGASALSRVPTRLVTAMMPRHERGRSAERR